MAERIFPVILSGGAGTRLWPLSRELYPKQLLPLATEQSLLQDTARRVAGENLGNPAQNLKSRDELLKALRESYDYGAKVWAGLTEEKALEMIEVRGQKVQRWSAILGAIQDNMNHYGSRVVYVRMNGLVPPRSATR